MTIGIRVVEESIEITMHLLHECSVLQHHLLQQVETPCVGVTDGFLSLWVHHLCEFRKLDVGACKTLVQLV